MKQFDLSSSVEQKMHAQSNKPSVHKHPSSLTQRACDVPWVKRHALKELLACPSHHDKVANMIITGDLLDSRDQLLNHLVMQYAVHRCMYALLYVVMLSRTVNECV